MRKLLHATQQVDFIIAELEAALSFCRLAEQSDDARIRGYARAARRAYDAAIRYLYRLDLSSKQFQDITANAERVKFALESLEARCAGRRIGKD